MKGFIFLIVLVLCSFAAADSNPIEETVFLTAYITTMSCHKTDAAEKCAEGISMQPVPILQVPLYVTPRGTPYRGIAVGREARGGAKYTAHGYIFAVEITKFTSYNPNARTPGYEIELVLIGKSDARPEVRVKLPLSPIDISGVSMSGPKEVSAEAPGYTTYPVVYLTYEKTTKPQPKLP